jgi:hypothetical protein
LDIYSKLQGNPPVEDEKAEKEDEDD